MTAAIITIAAIVVFLLLLPPILSVLTAYVDHWQARIRWGDKFKL